MITAQDIREKTFEKARFSGYDMASVDDFLEELAEDVTATQKENAVLKSKMKVLVDKIEEYRANEDALNMAVLSAQKLAVQIENDARARASAMLAEADKQVKAKVGSIAEQTAAQEKRLADAKAATAKFFDGVRALCNTQLKNIDAISSGIISSPEPEAVPALQYDFCIIGQTKHRLTVIGQFVVVDGIGVPVPLSDGIVRRFRKLREVGIQRLFSLPPFVQYLPAQPQIQEQHRGQERQEQDEDGEPNITLAVFRFQNPHPFLTFGTPATLHGIRLEASQEAGSHRSHATVRGRSVCIGSCHQAAQNRPRRRSFRQRCR